MSTRPLSSEWPQNRPRASAMAMAMPNGRLTRVATTATLRLSRTAVHSSGPRPIQSIGGIALERPCVRIAPGSAR